MAKKRANPAELPVWEITQLRATPARYLGRISAQTAEQAIDEWAELHDMAASRRGECSSERAYQGRSLRLGRS